MVWWSERQSLTTLLHAPGPVALALLLIAGFSYGLWRAHKPEDYVPFVALGNVVSLMHFWYDGFIWSVRKGQV